jgi:hypothetical protein
LGRIIGDNVNFSYNAIAIEDSLNNVVMNAQVDEEDITSFADAWQSSLAGKKSVSFELSGSLDMVASGADQTIFEGIGAGVKSTVFDPSGSGPGANDPEYQCTASGLTGTLVRSYNISLSVGGAATYRASLQNSGSTSRAVA